MYGQESELDSLINPEEDGHFEDASSETLLGRIKSKIKSLISKAISPFLVIGARLDSMGSFGSKIKNLLMFLALFLVLLYSVLVLIFRTPVFNYIDPYVPVRSKVVKIYDNLKSNSLMYNMFRFMFLDSVIGSNATSKTEKIDSLPNSIDSASISDPISIAESNTNLKNENQNAQEIAQDKVFTPEAPAWNLGYLSKGMSEEEMFAKLEEIVKWSEEVKKKWKGKLRTISGTNMYNLIQEIESMSSSIKRMTGYFSLKSAADLSDEKSRIDAEIFVSKSSAIDSNLKFFFAECDKFNKQKMDQMYLEGPKLRNYSIFFARLAEFKNYNLSLNTEEFISQTKFQTDSWYNFYTNYINTQKLEFNGQDVSINSLLRNMEKKDRDVRKSSFFAISKFFNNNIAHFGFMLNVPSRYFEVESQLRGYKDYLEMKNLENGVRGDIVESMRTHLEDSYSETSHKFYKIKGSLLPDLNGEPMKPYDLNAPIFFGGTSKTYSWDEAKDIVISAYSSFSKELGEIAKMFFDNNWIDAKIRPGKMAGAFSGDFGPEANPYILMSFSGSEKDLFTLAHEIGHGIHQYLSSKKNSPLLSSPSIVVSEIASMFGEQILCEYMMKKSSAESEKLGILFNSINHDISSILRQNSLFAFEKRIQNEIIKNDFISSGDISEMWMDEQKKVLGDGVDLLPEYKNFWPYILHLFYSRYYVYSYTMSGSIANSLFDLYYSSDDKKSFVSSYIKFLSSGSKMRPKDILVTFGFNISNGEVWLKSSDMLKKKINNLENLLISSDMLVKDENGYKLSEKGRMLLQEKNPSDASSKDVIQNKHGRDETKDAYGADFVSGENKSSFSVSNESDAVLKQDKLNEKNPSINDDSGNNVALDAKDESKTQSPILGKNSNESSVLDKSVEKNMADESVKNNDISRSIEPLNKIVAKPVGPEDILFGDKAVASSSVDGKENVVSNKVPDPLAPSDQGSMSDQSSKLDAKNQSVISRLFDILFVIKNKIAGFVGLGRSAQQNSAPDIPGANVDQQYGNQNPNISKMEVVSDGVLKSDKADQSKLTNVQTSNSTTNEEQPASGNPDSGKSDLQALKLSDNQNDADAQKN